MDSGEEGEDALLGVHNDEETGKDLEPGHCRVLGWFVGESTG